MKDSIKHILIACLTSLCIALLIGSLLGSWVWALAAFAIVLSVALSPADFGLGRTRPKPSLDEEDDYSEGPSTHP